MLWVLLLAYTSPLLLRAQMRQPIRNARAVRMLAPAQAGLGLPVTLTGTVVVLSGWKDSFFLQDKTAGISVDRFDHGPALHAGQRVIVEGVSAPGSFAPVVNTRNIRILPGAAPAIHAPIRRASELVGGMYDSQTVTLHGIVRSQQVKMLWNHPVFTLSLDIGSSVLVLVRFPVFDPANLPQMLGATIRIQGVCGTVFNHRRQFVALSLYATSPTTIAVEKPAPADPFLRPLTPFGQLLQFTLATRMKNLVRVQGAVTWSHPGEGFYLQQADQGLFVQWKEHDNPLVGTETEAVGYPTIERGAAHLDAAVVRVVGKAGSVAPPLRDAADMITTHDGFVSAPFEALLIRLDGKLVEAVPGVTVTTLLLRSGGTLFTARLQNPPGQDPQTFAAGTVFRLTGVCAVDLDNAGQPSDFRLQLRSAADLTTLKGPPWWNDAHTVRTVEILLASTVFFVLAVALFRQVTLKALASTDPLTGLLNRRSLVRFIDKAREAAQRREHPLLLLFLDVDHFKQINDVHGHRNGDLALQRVASMLREAFPDTIGIGRVGGDEFVAAVTHISPQECRQRIFVALERSNQADPLQLQLSLSVGIVACDERTHAMSSEDLLERADKLMYADKHARRTHGQDQAVEEVALTVLKPTVFLSSPEACAHEASCDWRFKPAASPLEEMTL